MSETRRGFLSKAAVVVCAGIVCSQPGKPISILDVQGINRRGKCQACGSKRLWWADHDESCKKGGFIIINRPDGAAVKLDMCADCLTMRAVDIRQVTHA